MTNRAVDDDGQAFHDANVRPDRRCSIRNLERKLFAHDPGVPPNHEQLVLVSVLNGHIAENSQHTVGGRRDIEPGMTASTGHGHLGSETKGKLNAQSADGDK